jgi:uncharacterized protein YecE (DUF72 family)
VNNKACVVYAAIANVPDTGRFIKKISRKAQVELFAKILAWQVDTCRDNYENRLPDLPGLTVSVRYAGHTKTIYDADYGPAFLKTMAATVETLAGKKTGDGWKRIIQ